MGIQGLLPLLKDIQVKTSVINFKGQTVGIDAYCWLHKGSYACAKDLLMGKPTNVYVHYVMKRVNMLISHGITPILVFDGGHLPAKAEKEAERRQKRKENKEKGLTMLRDGKASEANDCFQRACDITPEMASNVIEACYQINVQCIVAPYEADAQLAFLMLQGITQFTISEDSDLLLYGCSKVLYKMSADGDGILIDLENLPKVRTVKLSSFTREQFRWMCMLSGCDYLSSIKGMGLVKAYKLLQKYKAVKQCIRAMKIDRKFYVPPEYEENFRKAELVFKYQLVFDPATRCAVPLNNVRDEDDVEFLSEEDRAYAGKKIGQVKAIAIALGNVDPISGRSIASRIDFASGKIAFKSSGWATSFSSSSGATSKNKAATSTSTSRNRMTTWVTAKTTVAAKANSRTDVDQMISELTPPDSQTRLSEDSRKSLHFHSPKSEAEKSLKRLRSELLSDEDLRVDKYKRLYAEQSSIPSSSMLTRLIQTASRGQTKGKNHHSAFKGKFSNPFRHYADSNSPINNVVVSRFFNKKASASSNTLTSSAKQVVNQEQSSSPSSSYLTPPSPALKSQEEEEKQKDSLVESPPMVSRVSSKVSNPTKSNSFIDYLDQNDCRLSRVEKKDLTLKDPKKPPQQLRINKMCVAKENYKPLKLSEENLTSQNNITAQENKISREPLSPLPINVQTPEYNPINKNIRNDKGEIDFEVGETRITLSSQDEGDNNACNSEADLESEHTNTRTSLFSNTATTSESNRENAVVLFNDSVISDDDSSPPPSPPIIRNSQVKCTNSVKESSNFKQKQTSNNSEDHLQRAAYSNPEFDNEIKPSQESKNSQDCTDSQGSLLSSQDSSSQRSRKSVKVGLNRNKCTGIGISSFINKKPSSKISTYLEQFKNLPSLSSCRNTTQTPFETKESIERPLGREDLTIKDEEVLPLRLLSSIQSKQQPNSSKVPANRKKRNTATSNTRVTTNNGNLKQSKLSFDRFSFKRKAINDSVDEDVVCLS